MARSRGERTTRNALYGDTATRMPDASSTRSETTMKPIFGPQTQRLRDFLADLRDLSPAEIDRVTNAWKEVGRLDRAEAWAQLQRATTQNERYPVMIAASAARRTAMDTARRLPRPDWAFWAAAWDAAAAITADDRIGSHYDVLTAPLATVMPSLARRQSSATYAAHAPAPRLPQEPVRPRGG
jgi:hypothetical protein